MHKERDTQTLEISINLKFSLVVREFNSSDSRCNPGFVPLNCANEDLQGSLSQMCTNMHKCIHE